jgi:hypothetical protein
MAIADILAGLAGGLGNTLGNIQDDRQQQAQFQLQKQQADRQAKLQEQQMFLQKLEAMPHDQDLDPELVKAGAGLGFSSVFRKAPSGGLRRAESLSDKLELLRIESERLEGQANGLKVKNLEALADPNLGTRLRTLPLFERQVAGAQVGMGKVPLTPEEEEAELARNLQYSTAVAAAQTRALASTQNAQTRAAGGGSGMEAFTPNIIRDLGRMREEAVDSGGFSPSNLLKLQSPFVDSMESPQGKAYLAARSAALARVPPQAVNDAQMLIKANPNGTVEDLLAQAAAIPGFDPATDGSILEAVLRLLK